MGGGGINHQFTAAMHRILRSVFGKMTIYKVARFENNGRKKREIVKTITFLSVWGHRNIYP